MKFYIHHEEPPETTIVIQWPDDTEGLVKDVLQLFLKSIDVNLRKKLSDGQLEPILLNSKRAPIPLDAKAKDVINNKEDLFIKKAEGHLKLVKDVEKLNLQENENSGGRKDPCLDALLEEAREHEKIQHLRLAVTTYTKVLAMDENNREALQGLVSIYIRTNRGKEVLRYAEKGSKLYPDDINFKMGIADAYLCLGEGGAAEEYILKTCKLHRKGRGLDGIDKWMLQCLLAKAYLIQDMKDMAIVVYQGVIRENKDHLDATVGLANLVYGLSDVYYAESVKILVAAIAKKPDDKEIKINLVKLCRLPGGLDQLKSAMFKAWENTSAVFYVAGVFREHGGTNEAFELMKHCQELEPDNSQIVLTLAHLLEGQCKFEEALVTLKTFLERCSKSGRMTMLPLKPVLHVLGQFGDSLYLKNPSIESNSKTSTPGQDYEKQELYMLAILFTIVKIFYINGAISVVGPLVRILDPFTAGKDLHKTDIRNEAAYFSCISKIILEVEPSFPAESDQFIYHLGDSHCITSAWRSLRYKGTDYKIHPILSTGTKIWHLRPESVFYPKENFFNAITRIPDGATVLVNFGEIDCREGLLQCVEKCKYENLGDAINHVIKIYVDLLSKLHTDHRWKIFIHPVPPVLDITRTTVKEFNKRLKSKVKACSNLSFLDISDSLLNEEKIGLRKELEFDGTHLHPSYTKLLEDSLNSVGTGT